MAKPTIAAVNGVAYAGGALLAQSCDLCVAADTARFAVGEVKAGRGAPWAAPLPWLIPPRIAMQILLTGDPIDAARAYQIGLVNEVVPLTAAAQALAERIAENAPLSVRAAKQTVAEAERIRAPVYCGRDAQEGPAAFAAGRAPQWKGR
ncbi:MAG: enoyl-CoA hydratase-related protein [Streptosporangiaceae bacterium]